MAAPLPTTRHLLTLLLTTLTTPPISQKPSTLINQPYSTPSNPLKNLPSSQRTLLTTLHVLFPPPMLLQALDLLDRGLVLRLVEKSSLSSEENPTGQIEEDRQAVWPPQANIHLAQPKAGESSRAGAEEGKGEGKRKRNQVYQVRSSQPPKSRFRDSGGGAASGSNVYTVRLEAWNCSCAAFAYSAFPGGDSGRRKAWVLSDEDEDGSDGERGRGNEMGKEGEEWEFGGLSFDGREGGGSRSGVPVCKHLVACLLGERWDVLRGYVRERGVSMEEMGGVGGEG